ncbi:hypothetical protein V2J09_005973 [Rumex salicifolius]
MGEFQERLKGFINNRWLMCVLIFLGTNGETYFNTAALVSCVQNFPKSRGPIVGILKGFAVAMAVAQGVMAVGHFFLGMGWPGAMHVGTLLIGLGYGAHWAIVPATASELFGLKKFGALYNFLTLANPAGSLVFSGVIASSIYDREAEKQARERHLPIRNIGSVFTRMFDVNEAPKCEGAICFFLTSMIMSGLCIIAVVLSMILVHRTKTVYANLYGSSRS